MLRTAVIGVGHLGSQHARIHAALAAEGVSQFAAACDVDEARARSVAKAWSTEPTSDWRSLIGKVDAVSLAVPTRSKQTRMITGSPADAAKELVRRLREEARAL